LAPKRSRKALKPPLPAAYSVPDAVTATKTDAPIMQTPLSVQVVPQQVLQDQQVITIDEAVQNVSGVSQIANAGLQSGYTIRGFQTYEYYLDGVRVNTFFTPPQREMADIQQVEVLKGPASILYGRIEPGGLINLVTKKPLAVPYYELQQQIGSYGFYRTTMDMTGPVTPDGNLLYRFDAAYQNAQSFRDLDHNNHIFLAPRLHWAPTQDTQANFYLQYLHSRDPVDFGTPTLNNFVAPAPISRNYGTPDSQLNTNYDLRVGFNWTHAFTPSWSLTQRFDADFRDIPSMAVVPLGPDSATCTYISCPVPRIINGFPAVKTQDYYTSLDLTGHFNTFGVAHTLLVGGDYWLNHTFASNVLNFSVPSSDLFHPPFTGDLAYLQAFPDSASVGRTSQNWYGLYLQDQITLPYNIHLLAGFRYDNAGARNNTVTTVPLPTSATGTSLQEDAVKPRVGLLWQPIPQLSLYGNYVEGFGLANNPTPGQAPLPPTEARQWEAGMKTALLDGQLTATVAWFDIIKTNVATPSPDPILAAQGVQVATGAVRNTGVEFDIQGQILPELKLIGSFANINSKIIADNGGNVGNRLFAVPANSGSLWAVYEPQDATFKGLALGAGFYAQSDVEVDNANSFALPGYTTLKLMARYKFTVANTKVSFQVNANNLLDKVYYITGGNSFINTPGAPRSILGSIKIAF
jgi:iron complex outermembrane receptor protein